jgi:hypothetical protein
MGNHPKQMLWQIMPGFLKRLHHQYWAITSNAKKESSQKVEKRSFLEESTKRTAKGCEKLQR